MDFIQLISEVAAKTQLSKARSESVLHEIFEAVLRRLQEGELMPVTEGALIDMNNQSASSNILAFKRGNRINQHTFINQLRSKEQITEAEAEVVRYIFNQTKTKQVIIISLTDIATYLKKDISEIEKIAHRLIDKNILHTLNYCGPIENVCLGARWRRYL
ncbi:hypothetical protein [Metabacillus iocasae]|uniref:Uncharacterized protein n=1 Tax=Priestia iocasae TaxID=2291674 RepID=A0ABS2QVN6_9BACI|nr:hypothetical protein [Metabacillus iocasae]MBM7703540.1 hypothetical protein [Metabacillus iocasae]